jgi:exodeoxyribonuclease-3
MRITTWNVNGLRAAIRKGFGEHIDAIRPDVLLLQETRCLPEQLPPEWREPAGWHVHWHPAVRPGYSGVAVWSREPVERISTGLGGDDPEGRVLRVRVRGVDIVSVYLPSGSSGEVRQQVKDAWMPAFLQWTRPLLRQRRPVVLGGDLNVPLQPSDSFNARSKEKNSRFLPLDRAWFGELLGCGWRDLVREHYGEVQGPYTWWSNLGKARELDRGWRIDYLLGNAAVAKRFGGAAVHREGGLTVSDHAPVSIDLDV